MSPEVMDIANPDCGAQSLQENAGGARKLKGPGAAHAPLLAHLFARPLSLAGSLKLCFALL